MPSSLSLSLSLAFSFSFSFSVPFLAALGRKEPAFLGEIREA